MQGVEVIMSEKRIKNNQIRNINELENYLSEKAKNHNHYKYYAKREYIQTILSTNSVYFSNGENWNDTIDSYNFINSDASCYKYALCLSYSKSESVAMWLLYSGNDGCMIDYNQKIIKSILNAENVVLGYFENKVFIDKEIISKDKFKIELTDILYYGNSQSNQNDSYYVKRSDEVNREFTKKLVDKLCFKKKKVSWSYENECRLIVSITKNAIKEKYPSLKIILSDEYNKLIFDKTYDSPNCKDNSHQGSALKEDLNWNLCKNCNNKKFEEDF